MNRITPDQPDTEIRILHISDLHFRSMDNINLYYSQLQTDLKSAMNIEKLDYCVISGDIAHFSLAEEYEAALHFLNKLKEEFELESDRVIIVPGNHDLNWDKAESAYDFVFKRKKNQETLDKNVHIKAGEIGFLIRNKDKFLDRFDNFNECFYKNIYGKDYARDYSQQILFSPHPEDRILFLGLNSSWDIDFHFTKPDRINTDAVAFALEKISGHQYDGWLKILVLHHPVTENERINPEFLELLCTRGFEICMHGHIHEAIKAYHYKDDKHRMNIIGAGTFGALTPDRPEGTPLQYNLLVLDSSTCKLVVNNRKRIKQDGAWGPDHLWGEGNDLKPWYELRLRWHCNGILGNDSERQSSDLLVEIKDVLLSCDEFSSQNSLSAFIKISPLSNFLPRLNLGNSIDDMVNQTIAYFTDKSLSNGENCLVVLIETLKKNYKTSDGRHEQLAQTLIKTRRHYN